MPQSLVPAFHTELGEMDEPVIFRDMVEEFQKTHDGRHPLTRLEVAKEVAGDGSDSDSEDE